MLPAEDKIYAVIPAKAGLRRQDAGANIRAANGPKGMPQERRVIHLDLFSRLKSKMDCRFRGNDDNPDKTFSRSY
ncbi:MAG TPA: hypothetical protein VGH81_03900 [Rudaea sp.]|jgi:hypothetical protein